MQEAETRRPPEELSSAERVEFVQQLRRKVIKDETSVSDADLRYAIDLLRCERSVGGGNKTEKKPAVAPTPLDAF